MKHRPTALALFETISGPYMGRYPDPELDGTDQLGMRMLGDEPLEEAEDGCPGAWYRTPFVDSLLPLMRRRTDGGGRVDNDKYSDPDTPWQVRDAIQFFEREQERCEVHIANLKIQKARQRAALDAPAPANPFAAGRPLGGGR